MRSRQLTRTLNLTVPTMNIYKRLTQDHQHQRDLAEKLAATTGDSHERQRLWEEFRVEVNGHANAEEQTLYAALIERPDGQEKAQHSIAEHKESSDLMNELSELNMSSSGWLQKFDKLKGELEHHMDEEEDDVFPLAKRLLDSETAAALAEKFDHRKSAEIS